MDTRKNREINTPYELFGIECGKGWMSLIQPILDYIKEYNAKVSTDEKIEILQIKEKMGTLRIYLDNAPEELLKMVDDAERDSGNICELCGSRENVGKTSGYIMTMCYECVRKKVKDGQRGYISWKPNGEKEWKMITDNDEIIIGENNF